MSQLYLTCSDVEILLLISAQDDTLAFSELYERYFKLLFNYTFSKVNDQFAAQEIVQELFVSIWQQRHNSNIQACRPYLFSAVKNQSFHFIAKNLPVIIILISEKFSKHRLLPTKPQISKHWFLIFKTDMKKVFIYYLPNDTKFLF